MNKLRQLIEAFKTDLGDLANLGKPIEDIRAVKEKVKKILNKANVDFKRIDSGSAVVTVMIMKEEDGPKVEKLLKTGMGGSYIVTFGPPNAVFIRRPTPTW